MFFLGYIFLCVNKIFIKNINKPLCSNCVHFIKKDNFFPSNIGSGKCKLFGDKDIITGKIIYKNATLCREDHVYQDTCGTNGTYFKHKFNIF